MNGNLIRENDFLEDEATPIDVNYERVKGRERGKFIKLIGD